MPEIHFLCLSLTLGSDHQSPSGVWKFEQKTQLLTFRSIPEYGIRPLEIKITPLQLSAKTIQCFLDNDYVQQLATHGIEFFAQKWRSEFNRELTKGGIWHENAYEILSPMLSALVKNNEDQLRAERAKCVD